MSILSDVMNDIKHGLNNDPTAAVIIAHNEAMAMVNEIKSLRDENTELKEQLRGDNIMSNPAVAAIEYTLNNDDGIQFLRCWHEGDFAALRAEWDNVPDEVFIGADPSVSSNGESQ